MNINGALKRYSVCGVQNCFFLFRLSCLLLVLLGMLEFRAAFVFFTKTVCVCSYIYIYIYIYIRYLYIYINIYIYIYIYIYI